MTTTDATFTKDLSVDKQMKKRRLHKDLKAGRISRPEFNKSTVDIDDMDMIPKKARRQGQSFVSEHSSALNQAHIPNSTPGLYVTTRTQNYATPS